MNNVIVAIPAYSGSVSIGTFRSLLSDILMLISRGDRVGIYDEAGGAEIDTARAQIVAEFMATKDATHLVMVDHDVCWQNGGLARLIDSGRDVVAGLYPFRQDPISFPLHLLDGEKTLTVEEGGVCKVKATPGGFLCVTRKAIEKLIAAHPELEFESSKTGHPAWALFDHVWEGKTRLSEDLSFCARWRALGENVYIDPAIQMGHIGPKLFIGRLGEWRQEEKDEAA